MTSDDPLAGLHHIDVAAGLRQALNNAQLYQRLLIMFRDGHAEFPAAFSAAREAGNAKQADRMAHDLYAVAGILGMTSVQRTARLLEQACRDGAPRQVLDERLGAVAAELALVIPELFALTPTPEG